MESKTKAIYDHCCDVWFKMEEKSVQTQIGTENYKVYVGMLTRLFTDELNLPVAYYSHVMKELKRMDCVRSLKRGGGSAPSEWALLKPPNKADFQLMPPLEIKGRQGVWEQRIRNVEEVQSSILERLDLLEMRMPSVQ